MPRPIGTRDSAIGLSEIIDSAKSTVVLVSPYVQLSYTHKRKLSEASEKGKQILLVCRKNELYPNQLQELARIQNLKLLDHANVHAKCYFNESQLMITSLNFYNHSMQNNVELGTWFDNTESQEKFSRALSDAISALNIPELNLELAKVFGKSDTRKKFDRKTFEKTYELFAFQPLRDEKGFCIRCASQLHYMNGNYPLCSDCFVEWSREYDFLAPEKCCHWCGTVKATSKAKPLCYSCFTKYKAAIKNTRTSTRDFASANEEASAEKTTTASSSETSPPAEESYNEQHSNKREETTSASARPGMEAWMGVAISAAGIVLLIIAAWFIWGPKEEATAPVEDPWKDIVKQYYVQYDRAPENIGTYFAPDVERYIQQKDLTPQGVVDAVQKNLNEFSYPKTIVFDSTFSTYTDSLGRNAVSFWIDSECFRKSMKQYQTCRVQQEMVFDADHKIVSVKELKVEDVKFSFKMPN